MLDRSNRDCLLQELRNAGAEVFNDHRIRCFAHEDKNPSGSIHQGEDGVWRFHCFAGSCGFKGDVFDVLARAENKPLKDVLKENNPQSMVNLRAKRDAAEKAPPKTYESIEAIQAIVPGTLEGRYSYTNPQTKQADLVVLRFRQGGKKQFWQCSRRAAGWVLQRPPGLLPLYNRMELAGSPRRVVVVVEGEKCVHAVRAAGQVGTTSPMGAGKASYADWTPLAGKTCYLWPDHDEGGIKHMQEVEGILERLNPPCRLYWIDPAGLNLPPKGDVADFTAGKEKDLAHAALESVLDTATALGAARELSDLMEDTISGKRSAGSWPWSYVTSQSKALLPGTVTIFCGSPGVSKSFAILQALRHWHSIGVRAAVFELEEDRAYHLNRLLAQECEQADLLDPDWVKAHPDDVRRKMQEQAGLLNEIGRMIYSAPETQVDYKALVDWTESRAKEGYRVIVIDPVTAVSPQRDVWVADSEFMFRIKTLARVQQCSILLVTHPRKGAKGGGSMDDLAGGSAFQRFSQTVLWLEFLKVPKAYTVQTVCGSATITCNRVLHLFKCRNGRGTGSAIAMHWSGESLKLAEQGMIVAEKRGKKDSESAGRMRLDAGATEPEEVLGL